MSEKIHIENATNLTINLESSNQFQEDLLTLQQAITNMQNEINQLKSPKPETKQKDKPKKTETPGKITNKQQGNKTGYQRHRTRILQNIKAKNEKKKQQSTKNFHQILHEPT